MSDVVTDKAGRKIELRRVGVLEQLRLFKALGPRLSEITPYLGLAKIAASVAMIDDVPVPFPASEANVEALLERLGEDGVEAVGLRLAQGRSENVVAEAGN